MPLIDLKEPLKQSAGGVVFFATDNDARARVEISITTPVIDYYRDSVPPPDEESFRAFVVDVASNLYDGGPKDGYVIIDMEALDLPA